MRDVPLSFPRLHALLGDALHELPHRIAAHLEALLADLHVRNARAPRSGRLSIVGGEPRASSPASPRSSSGATAAAGWMTAAGNADHWCGARLQGLAAVLELLHAVHLEQDSGVDEPVFGAHLIGGLLVAGRLLAGYPEGDPGVSPTR